MTRIAERVLIDCPTVDVVQILTASPQDWITTFFKIASYDGERAGEVEVLPGVAHESPIVIAEFEPAEQILGGAVVVPFRWRAAGFPALFHTFHGRFVIWRTSDDRTRLAVDGEALGADVETVRLAGPAAVRSLLRNLRSAIEELARLGS